MNKQSAGSTLLRMIGLLIKSIFVIIGIILAWSIKIIGLALANTGNFFLTKLINK